MMNKDCSPLQKAMVKKNPRAWLPGKRYGKSIIKRELSRKK